MKRFFTPVLLLSFFFSSNAQTVDFESFSLPLDTFDNEADSSVGFYTYPMSFQNSYDTSFGGIWDGFSISTMRDDTTAGYINQYSAVTAGGYMSDAYAVAYPPFSGDLEVNVDLPIDLGYRWESLRVTNSTYAYLSMLNGDGFAKKFGGTTGQDPDFFKLHIDLKIDGEIVDSTVVDLADFTFNDSTMDYILDEWELVDLSAWDTVAYDNTSLSFWMSSSDTAFGFINTPTYFCLDDIMYSVVTGTNRIEAEKVRTYVSGNRLQVESPLGSEITIYDINGSRVRATSMLPGVKEIGLNGLVAGIYLVSVENSEFGYSTKIFIP